MLNFQIFRESVCSVRNLDKGSLSLYSLMCYHPTSPKCFQFGEINENEQFTTSVVDVSQAALGKYLEGKMDGMRGWWEEDCLEQERQPPKWHPWARLCLSTVPGLLSGTFQIKVRHPRRLTHSTQSGVGEGRVPHDGVKEWKSLASPSELCCLAVWTVAHQSQASSHDGSEGQSLRLQLTVHDALGSGSSTVCLRCFAYMASTGRNRFR